MKKFKVMQFKRMETCQEAKDSSRAAVKLMLMLMTAGCVMTAVSAFAITAPVAGSFAYDIYTYGVTDILQGPIGFVAGVGAICFGAFEVFRSRYLPAIGSLLGGAALLNAASIVGSMGVIR